MPALLRIATRGSDLARAQSGMVGTMLERALGVRCELVLVETTGDRIQHVALNKIGGKGLFVKEIEEALLEGRADVAVHSAKDLPAQMPPGLALGATPERADPRDALVAAAEGMHLGSLPKGARVGTGSLRRSAQLLAARPDLEVVPLRGNVGTRLRKLGQQGLSAVVLACAGLDRLDLGARIHERIAPEDLLPAVAQGTLALQCREGEGITADLAVVEHAPTRAAFEAERAFLVGLSGDCNVPLAAYAEVEGGRLQLRALLASPDGKQLLRDERSGEAARAAELGHAAAQVILAAGGAALLEGLG